MIGKLLDRTEIGSILDPRSVVGLLRMSSFDCVVPLSADDQRAVASITASALSSLGLGRSDRVVVAASSDAAPIAEAASLVSSAVAHVEPQGRVRLLRTLHLLGATVLAMTPCGAEHLVERTKDLGYHLDRLGVRLLLSIGEIPSEGSLDRLAEAFGAEVAEVHIDPVTGAAVATTLRGGRTQVHVGAQYSLVPLGEDGRHEIVVAPSWISALYDRPIRTGMVTRGVDGPPRHTIGSHVLVRGRWIPLQLLDTVLREHPEVVSWRLRVSRPGLLDRAVLEIVCDSDAHATAAAVHDQLARATASITPVGVDVALLGPSAGAFADCLDDGRGQHLGLVRTVG
jgi:phenylacetate-CoA ligase